MASVNGKGDVRTAPKAAQGYESVYNRTSGKAGLRWAEVDAEILLATVQALQSNGDALLLGATRDGGALVITVCSGDRRHKFYPTSVEECEATLVDITRIAEQRSGKQ